MMLKIVKRLCSDGAEREIIMFRNHWWQKWRPLFVNGRIAYVSYFGISCRSLSDERFDKLGLGEEQRKARELMLGYVLDAEEVYVGASVGGEYYIGYDVANEDSLEILRNVEE